MFKETILKNEDFSVTVVVATTEKGHSKLSEVTSEDELKLISNAGAKDAMDKLKRLLQ